MNIILSFSQLPTKKACMYGEKDFLSAVLGVIKAQTHICVQL